MKYKKIIPALIPALIPAFKKKLNCFFKYNDSLEANERSMYQQLKSQDTQTSCQAKEAARNKGKPFCKVCFDAGKPAKEYNSHYVKSTPGPNGKVTCPTLLIQACLNCGQPGHTSGYCVEPKSNRPQQSNQRTHPTIVLSTGAFQIGAEAELKLMTAMFKSKSNHDDFPSLNPKANQAAKQAPPQEEEPTHVHVYNPKSNAFGALTQKQPKQKSFQPPKQPHESPAKPNPMTMAERLKNTEPVPASTPTPTVAAASLVKPKFADMPPKSQFWWQDLDD